MINIGSKVIVTVLNGEFTGTVTDIKYTTLAELNPVQTVTFNKPLPVDLNTPVNMEFPITLYTVQIDENPEYTGDNPLKTYTFIREYNEH